MDIGICLDCTHFVPCWYALFFFCFLYGALLTFTLAWAQEDNDDDDDDAPKIETSLKGAKIPSKTDDEVVSR